MLAFPALLVVGRVRVAAIVAPVKRDLDGMQR